MRWRKPFNAGAAMNRSGLKVVVFVVAALLSLLLQEALARSSMEKGFNWILSNGYQAFGNLLIILCVLSLFVAVLGRFIPGIFCATGLLAGISFVNHMKIVHLQKPLFPWDERGFFMAFLAIFGRRGDCGRRNRSRTKIVFSACDGVNRTSRTERRAFRRFR